MKLGNGHSDSAPVGSGQSAREVSVPTLASASPTTSTGTLLGPDPSPSKPVRPSPQQTAWPDSLIAQVWLLAADTFIPSERSGTSTGTLVSAPGPPPSWPNSFDPQQTACPEFRIAHVCSVPAEIAMASVIP